MNPGEDMLFNKIISIYSNFLLNGFIVPEKDDFQKLINAGFFPFLEKMVNNCLEGKSSYLFVAFGDSDNPGKRLVKSKISKEYFSFEKILLKGEIKEIHPSRLFCLDFKLFEIEELRRISRIFNSVLEEFVNVSQIGNIIFVNTGYQIPTGSLGESVLREMQDKFQDSIGPDGKILLLGTNQAVNNVTVSAEPIKAAWDAVKDATLINSSLPSEFLFGGGEIQGDFRVFEGMIRRIQENHIKPFINNILKIFNINSNWDFAPLNLSAKNSRLEELEIEKQELALERERFELEKEKFEFEKQKKALDQNNTLNFLKLETGGNGE